MNRHRIGVGGPPEGQGRRWGLPVQVPETPKCIVKVDWPKCKDQGLRLDLEAIAFAEYIVGAQAGTRRGGFRGQVAMAKGQELTPVAMFCSHPEITDKKFTIDWMAGHDRLAGQDGRRWPLAQAWAVHLMRFPMEATQYRKSPREQNQFRIRLCPEQSAGYALKDSGRMETFVRKFMAGVESDFAAETRTKASFIWMAGAHYNTDSPHVHIGMRGITVQGDHVYFSQRYLRPTRMELARNPMASSPIEWRARGILEEVFGQEKSVRNAG